MSVPLSKIGGTHKKYAKFVRKKKERTITIKILVPTIGSQKGVCPNLLRASRKWELMLGTNYLLDR